MAPVYLSIDVFGSKMPVWVCDSYLKVNTHLFFKQAMKTNKRTLLVLLLFQYMNFEISKSKQKILISNTSYAY